MLTSLQLFNSEVAIDNYNNDFLILKPESKTETGKIGKAIFQKKFHFVEELIVTEVEICIKLKSSFEPSKIKLLQEIETEKRNNSVNYRLPVFFDDHEDWKAIELVTGFNKKQIITQLESTSFSVVMFGFLPGFVYLDGLDKSLHVPRKKVPSKYVKANSIAIGGQYLGLYSLDSPGGWHVIGQTPVSVLQIPELPPVVLNLEDQITIQPILEEECEILLQKQTSLIEYNA